jgi:hypothetical protein
MFYFSLLLAQHLTMNTSLFLKCCGILRKLVVVNSLFGLHLVETFTKHIEKTGKHSSLCLPRRHQQLSHVFVIYTRFKNKKI